MTMIVLLLFLALLVFSLLSIVLVLWCLTGQHLHPESSVEYPGDEFEVVCDPPPYNPDYENEDDDPETFSNRREIETRKNTIFNSKILYK